MGLDKLIQAAVIVAALAVASGRLPQILEVVRKAQLQLIQETNPRKADHWQSADLGICLHDPFYVFNRPDLTENGLTFMEVKREILFE